MCKHLGACTPEEVQSTAILRGVGYPGRPTYQVGPGMAIEAVSDLLECFGPVIRYCVQIIGSPCNVFKKVDVRFCVVSHPLISKVQGEPSSLQR